jgi:hypothetical protein
MEWISIAALFLSPVIAVLVSLWIQNRADKRKEQRYILSTLWANRRNLEGVIDSVRALNMIDIAFHGQARIRALWKELYDMYANAGLSNEIGFVQRNQKARELMVAIGKHLGYGKTLTTLDAERSYHPIGLAGLAAKQEDLLNELLRVLKASGGVTFIPKSGDN